MLWHFRDFSSLKTDLNVPSKSNKQNNYEKNLVFVGIFSATDEKSPWYESLGPDPDPY
jgi:hypothetical protein